MRGKRLVVIIGQKKEMARESRRAEEVEAEGVADPMPELIRHTAGGIGVGVIYGFSNRVTMD